MMLQTGSWLCFSFLFILYTCYLRLTLANLFAEDCTIFYSENVAAAVSVDCANLQLVSIPDNIPREVVSLSLWYNDIQKIGRKDFDKLSNLSDLDLSFNPITHIDDGTFVHLVELKVLRMNQNNLTTLTDNVFQGLSNLVTLSLMFNYFQFINPAPFQLLPSLQELSLSSNNLTNIITILQIPGLQVLCISIYELDSFQSKDLTLNVSSEIRELRVDSDSIEKFSITTAVFPHLGKIDLSYCCKDSGWEWDIPDKYFLRNITQVYFDGTTGMSFNSFRKALQSLDSLENLHMDNYVWLDRGNLLIACKIPTLRTLILQGSFDADQSEELSFCTQLKNLDLTDNALTELTIKQMNQLSHLNLSFNKLSKVPHVIKNLSMLQMLNLQNNHINDLSCSDFLNLTRLTHLYLDHNAISELKQCVFQHLDELKVLTVSHNSIWTFGETFKTGLPKLELLDLNKNNVDLRLCEGDFKSLKLIKHLEVEMRGLYCDYFEGLEELETLSLTVNLKNIIMTSSHSPCELPFLKSLKNFTIQYNGYESEYVYYDHISPMLSVMEHLEHFTAEHVYIVAPHQDTFKSVPRMKTLTLRSNTLPYLHPETFDPIQNLEALHLSNNKLKSLDFLVEANLTRLSLLDLSHNELTVINVSVFSFLPALRYLNMAGNPFTCDCSNADFQLWMLNNSQTLVVGTNHYICGYPLANKGTSFLDFDYHSCWVDSSFICYISSTCVIVLTLLTSFTYHFLRLHLLYGYYLFLAFLYDAKERKRGSPQRYDAFISYNVHDELWVCREMLPVLEGEQGWRLCLHHRDFLPGRPIIENITDAIYGSRKTICVISRHYLESEWCSREMQMASFRLFDEQKDVLILVFLEDIPVHQLSPYYRMRSLVKRNTYLSWSQARRHPGLFWQNLRRALDTPNTDLGFNQ